MKIAGRSQAAQGDVLVTPVEALPKGARRRSDSIVAVGEATGHNHAFPEGTPVYDVEDNPFKLWVVLDQPKPLTHTGEDHAGILFDPGIYEIDLQTIPDELEGVTRNSD